MKVEILKPTKSAMQSGLKNTKLWLMRIIEGNSRSINPLMGWTSSDNTKTQLQLKFKSKDEAIEYAKSQGFEYTVKEPETSTIKKKSYASNFN
jgi:hypothetical protein